MVGCLQWIQKQKQRSYVIPKDQRSFFPFVLLLPLGSITQCSHNFIALVVITSTIFIFLPKYLNMKLAIASLIVGSAAAFTPSSFMGQAGVAHRASAATSLDMKYKVAVVGGGPSGACAAEIFAQDKNIDTFLFERKMDNAKPCGGAIPLCMIGEFDIPETTVDRKVRLIIEIL